MKILVTGVKGQLGYDVVNELTLRGIETVGVDVDEMDITDAQAVRSVITESKVDAVIHCAAYTAVDKAEDMPEVCKKVNVDGTKNIAQVCSDHGLKMVYISTDYVFDGLGTEAFEIDSPKNPNNIYGQSKSDGEDEVIKLVANHFIVRISWAFGINGNNFINTMIKLGKERGEVKVVNDQIGSPTYTFDLARLLADMIVSDKYGIYHATNEGYCSWYDFAVEIFQQANMAHVRVIPVDSSEFPVKAVRPLNSRLSKKSLDDNGFKRFPKWEDALSRYLHIKFD
ncbi:MAG: dTDP-4-dehydrorhamnose reductase [Erysipelotrichaceae bacterium]|nr:MAG: dTDP-4-dehydrorhamnose [Erysipelotrichaceae bacterium]TXT18455.1 MAG: dTDP-4-dehydrorhamnose reductase [Erysipelotrichaceae bacterium]